MKRLLVAIVLVALVFLPGFAEASTYAFSPGSASVAAGGTFTVQVNVAAADQAVNALSGEISFPAGLLQVVSLGRAGSVVGIWVKEPTYSNASGIVRFEGAILNPGYQGGAGRVLTITFRAIGAGTAQVSFRSAAILANDGKGTNVSTGLTSARYVIAAPATRPPAPASPPPANAPASQEGGTITSETHPSPDIWSRAASAQFAWLLPSDATGVQYGLDRSAAGQPGAGTAGRIGSVTIPLGDFSEDGSYWFHLRYRRGDEAGSVQSRRILVDRIPPDRLEVSEVATGDPTEPRRELRVDAADASSGIDRLEVSWDGGQLRVPAAAAARFTLPPLPPGTHDVSLRAVDRAGNGRVAHAFIRVDPIPPPTLAIDTVYERRAWLLGKSQVFEPVVYGTAPAGRDVLVRFKPRGGEERELVAPVATDGTWRLAYAPLALGTWEVRAVARDERGALSLAAGPLAVSSDSPIDALISVLPWALVFALASTLLYLLRRRGAIPALKGTTHDA